MMEYRKLSLLLIWVSCFILASHAALVKEELTITWELGAPNGQEREMIKVNGDFPAPPLVFDEDDDVEVTVHNLMPQNTTIHWHGMLMLNTPWSDGVPGLSQTPIEPGQTFVYRFKAYPPGQYWYHSHSRLSLLDGLYGSLLIKRKPDATLPWSLISSDPKDIAAMESASRNPSIVVISDWDHLTSGDYFQAQLDANMGLFCVDSILINGKGSVFCPGLDWLVPHQTIIMNASWQYPETVSDKGCYPYDAITGGYFAEINASAVPPGLQSGCVPTNGSTEVIEVDPACGWVSLNFIDAATFKNPTIGIDQHSMWIYEVDGQLIEPINYDTFTGRAGERWSVMVKLDQKPQDYPMRVPDLNSQFFAGYAILRYKNSPENLSLTEEQFISYRGEQTVPWLDYAADLQNNATIINRAYDMINYKPFPSSDPSLKPAVPAPGDQQFVFNATRVNSSYQTSLNFPYLYPIDNDAYKPLLYQPNTTEGYDPRYVIRTKNDTWVDLIIQSSSSSLWPIDFPHAMHKHSSKTWFIGGANGVYNYSSVYEALQANSSNFNLDNPGFRDTWANTIETPLDGGPLLEQWMVLRYHVTNPGPYLFHCHIETHLAGGMAYAILDGVDAWPEIPPEYGVTQHGQQLYQGYGSYGLSN